ncbi:glycosyl hydrolase [Frankia sp. R43]|uniref:glycosyl hydrolase n=1 Tax=Frankia sp. R43 TaxID=269536 RepID=UPI0006CA0DA1|nr:glycosyl hydrolase [Frankia sp. R43]
MTGVNVPTLTDHEVLLDRMDDIEKRLTAVERGSTPPPAASTWLSGAYLAGNNYTQAGPDEWARRFGFRPGMWLVYSDREKDAATMWRSAHLINTTTFTDKGMTLVLAQSFGPERQNVTSGKNAVTADEVLSGRYDADIRAMGQAMVAREAAGFAPMIVPLAWEYNGDWFHHSAADARKFRDAWRRVRVLVRETGSKARFALIANKGYSQNPPSHNPLDAYPGDDVVDVIGVDAYDHYAPARTDAELARELDKAGGARWWANIAAEHRKGFMLQEWGIKNAPNAGGDKGGGDSAFFIRGMRGFFEGCAARTDLDFVGEMYFSEDDPANVGSSLTSKRNPKASAEYARLWGVA